MNETETHLGFELCYNAAAADEASERRKQTSTHAATGVILTRPHTGAGKVGVSYTS